MTMAEQVDLSRALRVAEIVVPVDFSTNCWRILPLAESAATSLRAQIRFLHVDTASPWREEEPHALRVTKTPNGAQVEVDVIADADAATGILRYLTGRPGALLALAHHGHGPAEVGTAHVFETVVRRSDAAVLAVGPSFDADRHARLAQVVTCVSSKEDSAVIVPDALALAQALAVPLDVINVDPSEPAWRERTENVVDATVASVRPTYSMVTGTVLIGSRPADEIVDYVKGTRGSLLALTTHARPMPERGVVGSVAANVLRNTPSGVLLRRYPD